MKPDLGCNSPVYTSDHVVQIGMNRINGNIRFNRFYDHALHIGLSGKPFQSFEEYGVMCHNEVALIFNILIFHMLITLM